MNTASVDPASGVSSGQKEALRRLEKQVTDLCDRYKNTDIHKTRTFLPTEENLDTLSRETENTTAALRKFASKQKDVLSAAEALYLRCFEDTLGALRVQMHEDYSQPDRHIYRAISALDGFAESDRSNETDNAHVLLVRLRGLKPLLAVLDALYERLSFWGQLRMCAAYDALAFGISEMQSKIEVRFLSLASAQKAALFDELAEIFAMARQRSVSVSQAPSLEDNGLHTTDYSALLEEKFGIDIAKVGRDIDSEIGLLHQDLLEACSFLAYSEAPSDVLARRLPAYQSPAQMFSDMRGFLAVARDAARDLPGIPHDERCEVVDVPKSLARLYPWGGYSKGDPNKRPLVGRLLLNAQNARHIHAGWLRTLALHEAYPGHHCQWLGLCDGALPSAIKHGGTALPLIEGAACRGEMVYADVYADRVYDAFVAWRKLQIALRLKADLMMHHGLRPSDEIAGLYRRYLGLRDEQIHAQILYHRRNPGYMVCYHYGYAELRKTEAESGLDPGRFTELLLSAGPISLGNFRILVGMKPPDRQEYIKGI